MEKIWPGLDINVCPIPVETDIGQVDSTGPTAQDQ
jgi:hypothetical protein